MPAVPEVSVSPTPRPRSKRGADHRQEAAPLYRALKAAGQDGLSWIECFAALGSNAEVGLLVVWMRAQGVSIGCVYADRGKGYETRFVLK